MASVDLLLAGRIGNGKSSTGNSILGKKAFDVRGGNEVVCDTVFKDGKKVTVVDGLNLDDMDMNVARNVMTVIELAERAVSLFPNGFSAALIVLKYGIRFTQQEKDAVQMIRSIFGADVIKKYGIIVMTHGDSFELDAEDDRITFEGWCKGQTGDVRDLFGECGHRYVLFNNRTKDNARLNEQNKVLMSKVAEIQGRVSRYTWDTFMQAASGRRKLVLLSKLPELQEKTTQFNEKITRRLRQLDDSHYSPHDKMAELEKIKFDIARHKDWLDHEDEGTNFTAQLLLPISITEVSIRNKQQRIQYELSLPQLNTSPQRSNTFSQSLNAAPANIPTANTPTRNQQNSLLVIVGIICFVIVMFFKSYWT